METNALTTIDSRELLTAVQSATQIQTKSAEQLAVAVDQLAKLLLVMSNNLQTMDNALKSRVTVTGAQAKALADAVAAHALQLCYENALPYGKAGRTLRESIWKDFRAEYTISDYHDLPQIYFEVAKDFISGWTSYATIRRIRTRLGL